MVYATGERFAEATHGSEQQVLLTASGITKRYGGIQALGGADLTIRAGEIHGLIGENGSGKSTLLGILSGQLARDGGTLTVRGQQVGATDLNTLRGSVAIVTQELSLAPELSVGENILMARAKPRTWRGIDWAALHRRAGQALARLNMKVDPRQEVGRLRIDQQQLVEIAKALELDQPILILDEPTSSLTEDEVSALAAIMRQLRDDGVAIIFVSHKLDEFFDLADHVTVLRDGRTVSSRPIGEYTREGLIEDMLGCRVEACEAGLLAPVPTDVEPVLQARGIRVPKAVHGVDIEIRPGEVVGLVGLEGAGRTELLEALFGVHFRAEGSLRVGPEVSAPLPTSPARAMARGLALVPADRKRDGLLLDMSLSPNLNLAARAGGVRARPVKRRDERSRAQTRAEQVRLQPGPLERKVGSLSGGNQQKVLLGKWLETSPTVLLLDEPTRGVDVGAKREIHDLIADVKARGVGVLCSSSDLEELLAVADRLVVMFRGRVVGELDRSEATQSRLSHLATGGSQ